MDAERLELAQLALDRRTGRLTIGRDAVKLAPHEHRIAELLLQNPGRVVPRGDLLARAWDPLNPPGAATLDAMMTELRRKLYAGGVDIVPVRGVGFQMIDRTPGFQEDEGFRALFFNAAAGIALLREDGAIAQCNPALQELLGYTAEELRGVRLEELVARDAASGDGGPEPVGETGFHQGELRLRRKDGSDVWTLASRSLVRGGGKSRFALAMFLDISERKRAEDALHRLSLTDELTGLHNRRGLLMLAEQQWRLARRKRQQLILVYTDLDGFKEVNDTLGHDAGDRLLVATAEILRNCCRESDTVARMGGDEFVILASESLEEGASVIRDRIQARIERFNARRAPGDPRLAASIGVVSLAPDEEAGIEELLARADGRMYEEKRGKGATRHGSRGP